MKKGLFFTLCFFALVPDVFPETFELASGEIVEGTILTEDYEEYYIETANGMRNLKVEDIVTIDGRKRQPDPLPEAADLAEKKVSPKEIPTFLSPVDDRTLAVKVGDRGFSVAEFESYITKVAHTMNVSFNAVTLESRKKLLEHAAQMEIIFQAAIGQRYHLYTIPVKEMIGLYLMDKIALDKYAVSDEMLKDFYTRHPEIFTSSPKVRFSYIPLIGDKRHEGPQMLDQGRDDPASLAWEGGKEIMEKRHRCLGAGTVVAQYCDLIMGQPKNTTELYAGKNFGDALVWMQERYEGTLAKFENLKRHELFALYAPVQQKASYEGLIQDLRSQWESDDHEELLTRAALKENYHRLVPIRQRILALYFSRHEPNWDEAIRALKPETVVEKRIQDLNQLKRRKEKWSLSAREWNLTSYEFDPQTGSFSSKHSVGQEKRSKWWRGIWAPYTLEFAEPVRRSAPIKKNERKKKDAPKKVSQGRESPLNEEVDSVAAIRDQVLKARDRADKTNPLGKKLEEVLNQSPEDEGKALKEAYQETVGHSVLIWVLPACFIATGLFFMWMRNR